jgi:hypothetical protein
MYLAIIILPLLGSIASGFFGRKIGVSGAQVITCTAVVLTTLLAVVAFFEVGYNNIPVSIEVFRWIDSESLNVWWGFHFDSLTVLNPLDAVWVKIPLYKVIFFKICCSDGGFGLQNTGMTLNTCFQNSCLVNFYLQKRNFSIKNLFNTQSHYKKDEENFLKWFVGFSDAESSFIINPLLKKDKVTISSFSFMFKIALHKDDESVLIYISNKLGIGKVRLYKNECIFNVTDKEGIKLLISIFDKYNLNTTKYLDYLDFKEAFHLYFNRDRELSAESVKNEILELKNKMNTNRVNFYRPENCKVIITKSWLLGFIEGDGSFFVRRDTFTPVFCIELTGVQLDVLLKIKEFLENYLGFDVYSLYKLKNSSTIAVTTVKARKDNKSSVAITVKNVKFLNNCFIPFLDDMIFLTKKGQDFQDFKTICRVVYNGAYRNEEIKKIILKLSYTMNNYRLSTSTTPGLSLSNEERDKLILVPPTLEYFYDGRAIDYSTGELIHQQTSCVYDIRKLNGEVLIENTLSKAASIVGVYPDTLSKHLDVKVQSSEKHWVRLNNHKIRRVPVFNLNPVAQ